MKFILASIVLVVGTVSAKTGSDSSIISKKDITATTNGLRGQDHKQHQKNRQIQELDGGEDFEEALAELFGDIPDVEDLSQDSDADTDTSQGLDINELVEDLLDSNGDSAFSGGSLLGDLLGEGNGGDSTSSGLLDFLGMDMYACSDTCKEEDKGVCDSFMMSMNPTTVFEDACNTGCIPQVRLDTCAQFCSDDTAAADDVDTAVVAVAEKRGMFDSLVQDLMCSDCKFYTCCVGGGTYDMCKNELATDVNDQATGDSILSDLFGDLSGSLGGSIVDIDNILEDLPDLSSLFPSDTDSSGLADTTTDWDIQELLDQMLAVLGLEDLFSGMQDLFDEDAMTADFETIADTITCDPDSCPIEGLCTGNLDFASFKPDDLCTQNAFFSCGDGLDTLCSECTAGDRDGLICNLCSIATCCQDGNSSFQECALSSPLAQGLVQDDADTVDVAAVPEDDTESAEVASASGDQTEVESPEETQDDLNTDGAEGVTEPLVPSQVISSVESASASSYVTTTMYAALAGVATLFLSL